MPLVTGRHKDLERVGPQLPIAILPSEGYRQAMIKRGGQREVTTWGR
jgi:hypothetical protein